jgi:hypothetical protein
MTQSIQSRPSDSRVGRSRSQFVVMFDPGVTELASFIHWPVGRPAGAVSLSLSSGVHRPFIAEWAQVTLLSVSELALYWA